MKSEEPPYGGDPLVEVVQRMRRVETRVTNMCRSLGLLPMTNSPNPMSPWVVCQGNTLYVSSPAATIGEISHAAVQGCGHIGGTFQIVLLNQPWGSITVPDQIPQREKV
ncbi:hypothetical protein [Pseudomonas mediterranea]|uniref:hypothetical protein n=1 Tax=Pseudomonas mediterranea TaxID=183795 RepID=UPI0006D8AFAD|nr:hypothetical protein [Pseudomonas mediterranea]